MPLSDALFFSRAATWSLKSDQLVVHDSFSPHAPRMITMEPWHEAVFMAADGEHTSGQFIEHMAAQYPGGSPPGLREQIHSLISDLLVEGILRVHERSTPLPAYFATDHLTQDPKSRADAMRADGLIK